MAGRSGAQPFIEKADARKRSRAKRHVRAEHAAYPDNFLSVVGDRQVEPRGGLRANLGCRIFGGQDAPLHRGELAMGAEKVLDLIEILRRGDEIIVEAYDYVASGLADSLVLDSALAGTRIVKML